MLWGHDLAMAKHQLFAAIQLVVVMGCASCFYAAALTCCLLVPRQPLHVTLAHTEEEEEGRQPGCFPLKPNQAYRAVPL